MFLCDFWPTKFVSVMKLIWNRVCNSIWTSESQQQSFKTIYSSRLPWFLDSFNWFQYGGSQTVYTSSGRYIFTNKLAVDNLNRWLSASWCSECLGSRNNSQKCWNLSKNKPGYGHPTKLSEEAISQCSTSPQGYPRSLKEWGEITEICVTCFPEVTRHTSLQSLQSVLFRLHPHRTMERW